jgi:predicted nucleotidyltransferase
MNFEIAVQALCDADVEFVVIGGWSAIFHGSARATKDLDIFFSRRTDNLRRLARALAPYHPRLRDLPPGLPFIFDEVTLRNSTVLTLTTDLGVIDLLAEVAGLGSFEQVAADAIQVEAFGRTVRTLDLESLIKSKKAAGREKDLAALPELESLRETDEL